MIKIKSQFNAFELILKKYQLWEERGRSKSGLIEFTV